MRSTTHLSVAGVPAALWMVFGLWGLAASAVCPQEGVSSASMGMARAGIWLPADSIRVEEYVNYHRHNLPMPEDGARLRLDVQWLRLESGRAILQAGLTTPPELDLREEMRPLNLVLVVDRSGSMAGDRIENVKRALQTFVERLRSGDLVTLVTYSDGAEVTCPATSGGNHEMLRQAIHQIRAGGSTNLHAGLIQGYHEAQREFSPDRINRVILLTDGIANQGVTDPADIARDSAAFNRDGIDLSTIGLGQDLNQELLRELADAGRGQIHFVGDAVDIEKTFRAELDSLLAPAARDVRLSFQGFANAGEFNVIGYSPEKSADRIELPLDDLNHGATQVVLADAGKARTGSPVRVTVNYVDAISGKIKSQSVLAVLPETPSVVAAGSPGRDLLKNFAIARVGLGLKEFARRNEAGESARSIEVLEKGIRFARKRFAAGDDSDVDRVVEVALGYLDRAQAYASVGDDD